MALREWQRRSRRRTGAFLVALAGLLPAAVTAQEPAEFAPFYHDPARPTVLRLDGDITMATPAQLANALRHYGTIDTLELASLGGSALGALRTVDRIEAAGLKTVIPEGAVCYSACSYLFLAGRERAAEGSLGVHQLSGADLASGQVVLNDLLDMFARFAVPDELRRQMLDTPPDRMHEMPPAELARLGLLGPARGRGEAADAATQSTRTTGTTRTSGISDDPERSARAQEAMEWLENGMMPNPNVPGVYTGSYVCGDILRAVSLKLEAKIGSGAFQVASGAMGGMAAFVFGDSRYPETYGAYELVYSVTGSRVTSNPVRWIRQPPGQEVMYGFQARLSKDGTTLEGELPYSDCTDLSVTKVAR